MNKTNNREIDSLIDQGFEVDVKHLRYSDADFAFASIWTNPDKAAARLGTNLYQLDRLNKDGLPVSPRGGKTIVEIKKDGRRSTGAADCSLKDNFNRRIGIRVACGRALANWNNGICA